MKIQVVLSAECDGKSHEDCLGGYCCCPCHYWSKKAYGLLERVWADYGKTGDISAGVLSEIDELFKMTSYEVRS